MWAGVVVRGEREVFAQLDQLAAIRRENGVDSSDAEAIALEGVLDVLCDIQLPPREFYELLGRWRAHDRERRR
jgi:hypothetical protein